MKNVQSELLSVSEAARLLEVSAQTLRNWADCGKIPLYGKTALGQRLFARVVITEAVAAKGKPGPRADYVG